MPPLNRRSLLQGLSLALVAGTTARSGDAAVDFDDPDDVYAALRKGPVERLRLAGGAVNVVFANGAPGLDRPRVLRWVERCATAMVGYFGHFPVAEMGLLVIAQPGNRVGHATTFGFAGSVTKISVGTSADDAAFAEDWVLVHEMLHCALPNLPRRALWLQEGNATYVEPIARAQAGQLSVDEVWRQSIIGMPRGLPLADETGMDGTLRHDRLYWGGAAFWLLAEIQIYQQSNGHHTLRDAMRAMNAQSGGNSVEWTPEHLMDVGDIATETRALSTLHARFATRSSAVDLNATFRTLGVSFAGRRVAYDATAPLADFRTRLTRSTT